MPNIMKGKRAGQELTLDEMSRRTGIHRSQLFAYEHLHKVPNLVRVPTIMRHYDMSFEEIQEHFNLKENNKEE